MNALTDSTKRYRQYNDSVDTKSERPKQSAHSALLEAQQLATQAEARMCKLTKHDLVFIAHGGTIRDVR
jgi:hypothetical protein